MNDDELERRIEGLFAEVSAPDGTRRWEAESITTAPSRGALVRLPRLRASRAGWAPIAAAAAISVVVGLVGLVASGGIHLSRGGSGSSGTGAGTDGGSAAGTASGPSGRAQPALAYDPTMHAVILFGGRDDRGAALDDTWAWDGSSWKQLHPATTPPARSGAAVAFDAASGKLVMAGGVGSLDPSSFASTVPSSNVSSSCTTSTETHAGAVGISVACSGSAAGSGAVIGCAPAAQSAAGASCTAVPPIAPLPAKPNTLTDTWTFDGTDWHQEHPAHDPPAGGAFSMVSAPGGVVIAGGSQYAVVQPAIACALPPVAPNSTPAAKPICPVPGVPAPSTTASRWDGHDWSALPAIPAYDAHLVLFAGDVAAVANAGPFCGPAIQGAADSASGASIACPLGAAESVSGGGSGSGSATATTATVGAATTVTATASDVSGGAGGSGSAPVVGNGPATVPARPLSLYLLRNGSWQSQQTSAGPSFLAAITSLNGSLVAVDAFGRTWTGDGRTWKDAAAPADAVAFAGAIAEDTDRHVAVLVGGLPTTSVPTYEFDGSAWHLRSGVAPTQPPVPSFPAGEPSILPAPASPPPFPKGPPPTIPAPRCYIQTVPDGSTNAQPLPCPTTGVVVPPATPAAP